MIAGVASVARILRPAEFLDPIDVHLFEAKATMLDLPKWIRWVLFPLWPLTPLSGDFGFFRMSTEELARASESDVAFDRLRATIVARHRPDFPLESLAARLQDPQADIREMATKALSRRLDSVAQLRDAEKDPMPMIWYQAVIGLIDKKEEVVISFERITALFSQIERDGGHLPTEIGKLPIEHSLPYLLQALENDSGKISVKVMHVLQQGRPESWEYFQAWLAKPEAESALRMIGLPKPLPEAYRAGLERMAKSSSLVLKVWAQRQLEVAGESLEEPRP
ncbi:hypothetical protein EON81_00635 [bacterium]|nr:MAG: hypothetical protein EON81_00635 [bacterium]